jgi:hypothetical protein
MNVCSLHSWASWAQPTASAIEAQWLLNGGHGASLWAG